MAINLKIGAESTAKVLIRALREQKLLVQAKLSELSGELAEIDNLLGQLDASHAEVESDFMTIVQRAAEQTIAEGQIPTIPEYKKDWIWEEKIAFILKRFTMPMSTGDLANKVMAIEPYRTDRGLIVKSISATLSMKSKDGGRFIKVGKNDRNETAFYLNDGTFLSFIDDEEEEPKGNNDTTLSPAANLWLNAQIKSR